MSLPITPGTSLQDFGPPLPDKRLPVRPRKQRTGPGPPRGQPAARALPGRRGRACTSQRGTGPQTPRSARAPCHWGAGLDAGPAGRPGRGPGQPAASCPETSKASALARVLSRDRRPRGSLGSPRPSHKPPWGAPRSPSAFSESREVVTVTSAAVSAYSPCSPSSCSCGVRSSSSSFSVSLPSPAVAGSGPVTLAVTWLIRT